LSDPRPEIARPEDAERVAILLDAFNREFGEETPGPEVLAGRIRGMIADDSATFLVTGTIGVAVLRFRPSFWTGGETVYLEELYIVPDARGRGQGRALLDAAVTYARTRGATSMEIGVDEPDEAAIRLYESAGFSCRVKPGSEHIMRFYERELGSE
jgi:ribosomal protein S18 acetylase RimI-like enzyme